MKEASGAPLSDEPEEGTFQNPPAQEPCFKFPPSQEAEDASGLSLRKDSDPMVSMPKKMCLTDIVLHFDPECY